MRRRAIGSLTVEEAQGLASILKQRPGKLFDRFPWPPEGNEMITILKRTLAGLALIAPAVSCALYAAEPTDVFFSEYIEGSSNNKALEIYNGTGSSIDLSAGGYAVKMYFNGSASAGLTINLTGSVANGDVYVLAQSSAVPAILAQADQTNGAGWFNGDDAVVLTRNDAVIDSFGQVGVDPGSEWTGGGQDDTLRRLAGVCAGDSVATDAFDASIEWAIFPQDTFDGLGAHSATCDSSPTEPKINEFSASTTGTDVEYVEIYGDPNTDYSAYTLLEIEGDDNAPGTVDEVIPIGTTDANGFYLASLPANALENGTITLLLVSNFSGTFGADLDTDDDGVLDSMPWDAVVDSVSVWDGGASDWTYGAPQLGPNYDGLSPYAPGGASRFPDGTDTESPADWVRNDFDLAGIPGYTGSIVLGEAYNTPGEANQVFVPPPEACGDSFTPIYAVQGGGATSPLVGTEVAVEGIVTGDFQNNGSPDNGDLNGFHVQDPLGDGDMATSDGVFVYAPGGLDVAVGDEVRVRGNVSEYGGMTEITASEIWICSSANPLPDAAELGLPVLVLDDFEPFEGMRVTFPQSLVISEYFNFDRYGEIVLASDRLIQPTAVFEPGSQDVADLAALNLVSQIILDDGRTAQNPDPAIHPNGDIFDLDNLFRGGDTVQNVTGVLDYGFGRYRVQPTQAADHVNANPRTEAPDDVGGSLKVASFNVLNYFSTIDDGSWICGPLQDQECRGADDANEFTRQRDKIIAAISAVDAAVAGLIEIENHVDDDAVKDLVNGLNDFNGPGAYDYVATGVIGTDAIKVALIYQPAQATPVGEFAILDSSVDPRFLDDYNRPSLAQTFVDTFTGGVFTVVVNHLKSKGSDCNAVDDPDLGDGASNCNLTRTAAAEALVDWLATDPTGSDDADILVIGDLNSYDKEDPIDAIVDAGYDDLLALFNGEFAYTYVFDGQIGYLDHALASQGLTAQVAGTTAWHINADEPDLIDYDTTFKKDDQDAIYSPDAYRSSDHDPVIVGLDLLRFDFSGFFPPIKNAPDINKVKAGASVPVKFSLGGDFGLDIFAPGYPMSREIDCETGAPGGSAPTDTAGGSTLYYDAYADQYVYVWQTELDWLGTCRQLVVQLEDGSLHYANFQFR